MTKYSTVYITKNGIGAEGLSPSFTIYKDLVTGNNVTPVPSIDELGGGLYRIIDTKITFGARNTGLIDAGDTINMATERYIPYIGTFEEFGNDSEVLVSAVFDEPNSSMLLVTFLQNNGQLQLTDLDTATIQFYDFNHVLLFTVSGAASTNGMFIFAQSMISIPLTANRPYYMLASISLTSGLTTTSGETLFTLE